jgi:hypothetical protein
MSRTMGRRALGMLAGLGLLAAHNPQGTAASSVPPITQTPMRREERKVQIPVTANMPRALVNFFRWSRPEPIWTGRLRQSRYGALSVRNWGGKR